MVYLLYKHQLKNKSFYFCCKRHYLLWYRDVMTSCVKISCFCVKACLVFHWCFHNEMFSFLFKKTFFPCAVEWCCVVLESSGIFVNHSHTMLMIKWILMFLLGRMETVMTGVYSSCSTVFKPGKRMTVALFALVTCYSLVISDILSFISRRYSDCMASILDSNCSSSGLSPSQGH